MAWPMVLAPFPSSCVTLDIYLVSLCLNSVWSLSYSSNWGESLPLWRLPRIPDQLTFLFSMLLHLAPCHILTDSLGDVSRNFNPMKDRDLSPHDCIPTIHQSVHMNEWFKKDTYCWVSETKLTAFLLIWFGSVFLPLTCFFSKILILKELNINYCMSIWIGNILGRKDNKHHIRDLFHY